MSKATVEATRPRRTGRTSARHRAAAARPPCRAGRCRCRTSVTACTRGSRSRTRSDAIASRVAASQSRAGVRGRARRNPRRPGGRRRRRRWRARCRGAAAVDTPPMSHRSQVANSGSSPMRRARRRAAAPGRSAASRPRRVERRSRHRPPHRAGAQLPGRQVQRLLAEHLAGARSAGAGTTTTWLVTSTVPKAELAAPQRRVRSVSRMRMSVRSRADVE